MLSQDRLARAVNEAEVLRLFDGHALERTLERLPGRRGRHRLARVVQDHTPEPACTRSEAERRVLHLCAEHGLPTPSANTWIAGHEVDLSWADARLAVEVDGALYHRTSNAFHADRRRDRALAAEGIQVSRVTWRDLEGGPALAAELRAIRNRRLRGPPSGAPPCP